MTTLAIKGNKTRGSEVIALLGMLGGVNTNPILKGNEVHQIYYIRECNNEIVCATYTTYGDLYQVFTLEEFEEKFPYKVRDKVTKEPYVGAREICEMRWEDNCVKYGIGVGEWFTAQQLQPYKKQETMKNTRVIISENGDKVFLKTLTHDITEINIDKDYEIIEENGKFYAIKKKPKYPKTYEECCDILNTCINIPTVPGYKGSVVAKLQQLLICRGAYWKIAEDWKPEWSMYTNKKYCIKYSQNEIKKCEFVTESKILAFPTKEMRDAFYENFKDLIELCKELL